MFVHRPQANAHNDRNSVYAGAVQTIRLNGDHRVGRILVIWFHMSVCISLKNQTTDWIFK